MYTKTVKTVAFHLTFNSTLEKRKRRVDEEIKQRKLTTQNALVVAKPKLIHSVFMFLCEFVFNIHKKTKH